MNRESPKPEKKKKSKLTERKRKREWTMVGLLSQAAISAHSSARHNCTLSTQPHNPIFFFLSFFGGYQIINFFFSSKKKGLCAMCKSAKRNELTQCETTTELAAASFQAEVAIKGLVCQPSMRQPSFSSTL